MRMRSSSPVREWTKWWPSKASSTAAMVPRTDEPSRRLAIRPSMKIEMVPSTQTANRHPNELSPPKIASPEAMTHLPTGPWTTRSPSVELKTLGVPWVKASSGLSPKAELLRISTPHSSIDQACLT
jgi:hypothetical protein